METTRNGTASCAFCGASGTSSWAIPAIPPTTIAGPTPMRREIRFVVSAPSR
jgi:hypothetical protein